MYPKLCSISQLLGLSQVATGYTHVSPSGHTSLIDLVLVSSPHHVRDCSVIPPLANSDHLGLHIELDLKTSAQPRSTRSHARAIWRYSHADFTLAQQRIRDTKWDELFTDDIDSSWLSWQSKFLEIMEECIPRKVLPPRRRNLPWLNKGAVQSMRRRNTLFKRAKQSGNHQDYVKYCRARNTVVSQLRNAKAAYFHKINPANPKQFWKAVKHLNKGSSSIPVLTHNNRTFESDEDKANVLNSFFASCFNDSLPPLPLLESNSPASQCNPDILCTEEEVVEMLQSLNIAKASGQDGISARMLKATAAEIAPSITKLFNLSIQSGRPPIAWKSSNVVPIPKKQGAKNPNEFRPISLLPILSKILEKHFHFLISDHVREHSPLSNCQWGFQPGKSTVAALLSTTQDWFQQLEKGKEIGAVFFDFHKAFDTVPHQPLVDKLSHLGLNPQIVKWVHNYLADR